MQYVKKKDGTIVGSQCETVKVTENTLKKLLDTTKSASYLFNNYTGESVDDLIQYDDTSNVTDMSNMFNYCDKLTSIPLLNTSNVTKIASMFNSCRSLVNVQLFDTSKVKSVFNMFYFCDKIKIIPQFNFSNVTNASYAFSYCSNLEEIHFTGLKVSFDISNSTKFTEAALVEILNNLGTPTTSQTLTMGATNLAKLTDEEKAIATDKGWTLN